MVNVAVSRNPVAGERDFGGADFSAEKRAASADAMSWEEPGDPKNANGDAGYERRAANLSRTVSVCGSARGAVLPALPRQPRPAGTINVMGAAALSTYSGRWLYAHFNAEA